ncbi:TonB-dependent receptor [Parabacteroides sp. OttesenSCG-928-K15]|nr:TonB-dependent receptor [Parabacteroides sp. OttesenSCG-928-K15]
MQFRKKHTLLIMFFFLLTSISLSAQLSQRIDLKLEKATIKKFFTEIENKTEYTFMYKNLDLTTPVSITANQTELSKILDQVLTPLRIGYEISGKRIILKDITPAAPSNNKRNITGTIIDTQGEPVIGANVVEKGTTNGVVTNIDGSFSITLQENATLQVSYIGYITQEVAVRNQASLEIILREDSQTLEEVVVVGFGTQKKVNLTGAVSTVDSKSLVSRPVINVSQALQGLVPGLNFSYGGNGGELNNDMVMNIRGSGTIGDGSRATPLVLIDGMEGNMNALNPQDVESISVLKDAAASSIYGSRAPFGVILITTKKGKAGKTVVNYNNNFRWTKATNMPDVVDSYRYAQYFNRAAANNGETPAFSSEKMEQIKGYLDGTFTATTVPVANNPSRWDWVGNSNNDWYDIYFGGTAFSQEHAVSANGGSERIQYYLSGNFMNQTGLISFNPDKLKRFTATAKVNAQITSWASLNYNSKFIRKDYRKASYLNDNVFYHNIAKRWPTEPHYDPNGNMMSMAYGILNGGEDKNQTDWLYQQLQVVLEPIKNWKIFGELNYKTITDFRHIDKLKVNQFYTNGDIFYPDGAVSSVAEAAEKTNFFNPNVYSEYLLELNDGHTLKGMVGFQSELNQWRKLGATKNDLITDELPTINTATGKEKIDSGRYTHWATAGFFGRINYDYKGRYLVELNGRYDGTSRFARDKRWNFFPSVSVGWNLAREAFMEPYEHIVNNLKIRGSWGELGNQNTEKLYPYIQLMKFSAANSSWLINNQRSNTSNEPDLISALLGWETMRSWNIGFDLGMLNNRFILEFNWFNRQTLNMVGPAPELPVILGTSVPKTNNADMLSRGFELDVTWRDQVGQVRYGAHLLLSDDRQKVTNYPNKTGTLSQWRNGQYMGEIWGYETHGIAKSDDEMDAWLAHTDQSQIGRNWMAGDIMYVDLNGDGKINTGSNTITDPGDRKIIGNSSPRFRFGLDLDVAWKGIDLRVFFQGVAKRDYWFSDNMFWGAAGGKWQSGCFEEHLDFFRQEGDEWGANLNGYFPRPTFDAGKNQQVQTKYLQNAAYIRLKNLQVGYTIPASITRKIGISNFRIFFSGENLFTLSPLPDSFDPEILGTGYASNSAKSHPLSRTFSTGFSVNF